MFCLSVSQLGNIVKVVLESSWQYSCKQGLNLQKVLVEKNAIFFLQWVHLDHVVTEMNAFHSLFHFNIQTGYYV